MVAETSIRVWTEVTYDVRLDLPIPCMRKGIVDGSVLMDLGSLVTLAERALAKVYHIVLDNSLYAMTGGEPIPKRERRPYVETYEFDGLEERATRIGKVLGKRDSVLIVMKTVPELTDWRNTPPKSERRMSEAPPA